ncbi:hypothetical protein BEWA_048860 [Theileria equi strain WA]|uniref:Uncharacterized protein n=1 Tax=Theileria equi strain WA TaxID=1537102 RepID=L1LAX4_THEEQ|nr:hypothetical protein BEWA_048860 [Theileria equi strain WA]EKX72419.1 hypothetical protein BEWA_048860 [Theileria equi strain WA]|eukprot:XP_004831871.1 hypothetical protein BEWA_048860 [Theileria equi strain WA]
MGAATSTLKLNLQNKCVDGNKRCNCSPRPPDLAAIREDKIPKVTGFVKYTHSVPGGCFTLLTVLDENCHPINGIHKTENVTSVSAYYWKHELSRDGLPTKALLVEVVQEGGKYTYYKDNGSGTKWSVNPQSTQLQGKELETQLDSLNCRLNDAVTMDLTKTYSETHKNGRYCCEYHKSRVAVTSVPVSCENLDHKNKSKLTAYKHSIEGSNMKLACIKYYLNAGSDDRKNIRSTTGLQFPISTPITVYTFNCDIGNPVLIYVESKGDTAKGWFRKKPTISNDNTDEEWTEANELKDIAPGNIKDCSSHTNWKALVAALNSAGCNCYSKCNTTSESGNPGTGAENKDPNKFSEVTLPPEPPKEGTPVEYPDFTIEKASHFQHADSEDPEKDVDVIGYVEFSDYRDSYPVFPVDITVGSPVLPYRFDVEDFEVVVCDRDTQDHKITIDYDTTDIYGHDSTIGAPNTRDYVRHIDIESTLEPIDLFLKETHLETYDPKTTKTNERIIPVSVDVSSPLAEGVPPTATGKGGDIGEYRYARNGYLPFTSGPSDSYSFGGWSFQETTAKTGQPQRLSGNSGGTMIAENSSKRNFNLNIPSIITSSILGASGSLTGFGWWIYKRSRGDPWVRYGYPIECLKNVPYLVCIDSSLDFSSLVSIYSYCPFCSHQLRH